LEIDYNIFIYLGCIETTLLSPSALATNERAVVAPALGLFAYCRLSVYRCVPSMALCTLQPGSSILPPAFCHPARKFVFYQMRLIGKEKVGGSSGRGAIKRPSPLLRIQVLLHNFGGSVPMDGRSMSWIYRLIALLCCL